MEQETNPAGIFNFGLALPAILSGWLSASQHARVICDSHFYIVWANQQFFDLSSRNSNYEIENGRVTFLNRRDEAFLAQFMGESDTRDAFTWMKDEEGRPRIAAQVQRIACPNLPHFYGLRLVDAQNRLESDFRHFQSFFNLTKTEASICGSLLNGRTVAHIVADTQKSNDTIRFHIKNLYAKIGVTSREELFAQLHYFMFS